MLFDTHCHLTLGELAPEGAEAWQRAQAAGVGLGLVVGIDAATSRRVLEFVEPYSGLFAAVGLHPNDCANKGPEEFAALEELALHPKVRAIGETGLDYYRDSAPKDAQADSLRWHADLALRRGLPLVLHIREAYAGTAEVLAPYIPRGLRAVLHCFGGNPEDLEPFLSWGFYVSISGIVTYPKAENVRAAARLVPLERLLIETDAPWLAPHPMRGKRNEPALIVHTATKLAEMLGLGLDEFSALTTGNARKFLALD
jgi:TatD DNase family protein